MKETTPADFMVLKAANGSFVMCEESRPCIGGPANGYLHGIWSCLPPPGYSMESIRIAESNEELLEVWAFDGQTDEEFWNNYKAWFDAYRSSGDCVAE